MLIRALNVAHDSFQRLPEDLKYTVPAWYLDYFFVTGRRPAQ